MSCDVLSRLKNWSPRVGKLRLDAFRIFATGESGLFFSALRIFLPEAAVEATSPEQANIRLFVADVYATRNEYCALRITPRGVEIRCRDAMGARNAAAILAQLVRCADGGYVLPCAEVEDWPDAQYRAFMVESSGRVWTPMAQIRRYIHLMALCRMNVLLFHFMEDPGCTVPLESVPGFHGGPNGEKFTRQEVEEMIAYAAALGIRVTPFVEVLSHAADLALAEGITCPGDPPENLYDVCLGQEKTYEVIERIIREIARIFPDDVIHIGADEYDMSRVTPRTAHWDQCPHCRALSEKLGFTTLRELFLYGIQRINRMVNEAGKVMMMWNADLHPGHLPETLDRNFVVHYYRYCSDLGREDIYDLHINGYADEGFSVVNSYYPQTYMDLPEYMSAEKLNSWTHLTDPKVSARNLPRVVGGCLCAWEDYRHYCRTVPAAIVLFADRLWNAEGDPVPYGDAYGKTMTRLIFGGKLPEHVNVFACVGDVLPPLQDDKPAHPRRVFADRQTLLEARSALAQLEADETARAYMEAVDWVIREKEKQQTYTGPQKERVAFKG